MGKITEERLLEQLNKERYKDNEFLEQDKKRLIQQLKSLKKEDVLPKKPKKISLWKRIRMVLGL
jgi:hypothetical protein